MPYHKNHQKAGASVQKAIPIDEIVREGLFRCGDTYSITCNIKDVNYTILDEKRKEKLFSAYADAINSIDPSVLVQITLINTPIDRYLTDNCVRLKDADDGLDSYRRCFNEAVDKNISTAGSFIRKKMITLSTVSSDSIRAENTLDECLSSLVSILRPFDISLIKLSTFERLEIIYASLNDNIRHPFIYDSSLEEKRGHSFKDSIAPSFMDIKCDHIQTDDKFISGLFLTVYPAYLKDSFFTSLASLDIPVTVTMTFECVPPDKARKSINDKLMGIEASKIRWQRKQNDSGNFNALVPYDIKDAETELRGFLTEMDKNDQRIFTSTLTVLYEGRSRDELNLNREKICSVAEGFMVRLRPLTFQMLDGLNTSIPYGLRRLPVERTMTTQALAASCIPFETEHIFDISGYYYGANALTGDVIMADRNRLINPNGFILGTSGSGKSFKAKEEIAQAVLRGGSKVIIIDPEGEYSAFTESLGGTVIRLGPECGTHINILELTCAENGRDDVLNEKSQFLSLLVSRMCERELSSPEKSCIDECVRKIYSGYIKNGYRGAVPTLRDLYNELALGEALLVKDMLLSMEKFIYGSLSCFSFPSNVDLTSRFLTFDISSLGNELKAAGMLVIMETVKQKLSEAKAPEEITAIYIDEIHMLTDNEFTLRLLSSMWKRVRKHSASMCGITQNVGDILSNGDAEAMLSNSEFIILMSQSAKDSERLAKLFSLSPLEKAILDRSVYGQGLIRRGSTVVPFTDDFPPNELYKLMDTSPKRGYR
mgnify:CR=1 FL=1